MDGMLRYCNKKKAPGWLRAVGLQLPEANTIKRLNQSVAEKKPLVDTVGPNGTSADADSLIPRDSSGNSSVAR